ncbi:unnamed protein product, partial [marine sediment metagenome]
MSKKKKGIRMWVVGFLIVGLLSAFGFSGVATAGLTADQILFNCWNQADNTLKVTGLVSEKIFPCKFLDFNGEYTAEIAHEAVAGTAVQIDEWTLDLGLSADLKYVEIYADVYLDAEGAATDQYVWIMAKNSGGTYNNVDQDIRIATGTNDVMNFTINAGAPADVTLDPGTYTPLTLAAELKKQMELGDFTDVTVTYNDNEEGKFKIDCTVDDGAAFTFAGSNAGITLGFIIDMADALVLTGIGAPNVAFADAGAGYAQSTVQGRLHVVTFPSFWDAMPCMIKVMTASDTVNEG